MSRTRRRRSDTLDSSTSHAPGQSPHDVKLPHRVTILGIERINVAGYTDLITAGVADVDQPVRGDRRHWYRDARSLNVKHMVPQYMAVCRIHRKHVRVRGTSKQPSVRVGEATVYEQHAWRIAVPMLFPLFRAGAPIDRIGSLVRREVHRAVNNKRTGLKRRHLWQRIRADRLQFGDVGTVDLLEWREPIPSQGAVVSCPVGVCDLGARRHSKKGEQAQNTGRDEGALKSRHGLYS